MDKYISSIDELNLQRTSLGGSCSNIYDFTDDIYFKSFDEDYQDLHESINQEFYETISYLANLEGMPYIVRGKDIYRSKDKLFGYSMPKIAAVALEKVPSNTLVEDIFHGFYLLRKDILTLANNGVKTEDVGGDNILFNGYMYLIDLDLSIIDLEAEATDLYQRTGSSILCGIRQKVLGEARYNDKVLMNNVDLYLEDLKEKCSFALGRPIMTISDMQRGYQKVKTLNLI